mmetsp:Transcript_45474/g.110712  ORF Transcript_45474/g.110712 Transcript_45474/m.110712 type:complete len:260 (+) Transcript_45474:991-1770(+)
MTQLKLLLLSRTNSSSCGAEPGRRWCTRAPGRTTTGTSMTLLMRLLKLSDSNRLLMRLFLPRPTSTDASLSPSGASEYISRREASQASCRSRGKDSVHPNDDSTRLSGCIMKSERVQLSRGPSSIPEQKALRSDTRIHREAPGQEPVEEVEERDPVRVWRGGCVGEESRRGDAESSLGSGDRGEPMKSGATSGRFLAPPAAGSALWTILRGCFRLCSCVTSPCTPICILAGWPVDRLCSPTTAGAVGGVVGTLSGAEWP